MEAEKRDPGNEVDYLDANRLHFWGRCYHHHWLTRSFRSTVISFWIYEVASPHKRNLLDSLALLSTLERNDFATKRSWNEMTVNKRSRWHLHWFYHFHYYYFKHQHTILISASITWALLAFRLNNKTATLLFERGRDHTSVSSCLSCKSKNKWIMCSLRTLRPIYRSICWSTYRSRGFGWASVDMSTDKQPTNNRLVWVRVGIADC